MCTNRVHILTTAPEPSGYQPGSWAWSRLPLAVRGNAGVQVPPAPWESALPTLLPVGLMELWGIRYWPSAFSATQTSCVAAGVP